MLNTFEVNKVLIIAPLRVARDTWPAEIEKWDHLKGLDISVIVGDVKTRIAAVHHPAIIYIVNRENIKWLVEYYEKNGMRWDFGMVVIDELSSFKNYQSQRFKYLRKVRPFVKRWVGLTGTPSSNGLMDLWAEIGILDGGERLGKFIGRYDGIGIAVGNGIGAFDLDDCFREEEFSKLDEDDYIEFQPDLSKITVTLEEMAPHTNARYGRNEIGMGNMFADYGRNTVRIALAAKKLRNVRTINISQLAPDLGNLHQDVICTLKLSSGSVCHNVNASKLL